jgi:hypothetical protein
MKISASMFIRENVLVDPFMTDLKAIVVLEPARYLLRAQVLADQRFDQDPGGGFYTVPDFLTSIQRKLMGLLRSIAFQHTIASEFSANRGLMNPDKMCNFGLAMSCFQKCINLVSLDSGKLRIGSHQCSFDVVV